MKNIYIAFYYNKRSKTIHIKGGSTSLDPRLRMQMHFAHGTAGQHPYPNVLNEDDLIYTRQYYVILCLIIVSKTAIRGLTLVYFAQKVLIVKVVDSFHNFFSKQTLL